MDKILEINGVKYIQKSEYDKAKRDVDNIKQLVSSSIAGLNDFLGNQVIAQSIAQKPAQVTTQETEKEVENEITQPPSEYYSIRNKNLQIRVSGQREYKILRMTENGYFYAKPNRKLIFDIRTVMQINKRYNSSTNKQDVSKMAKDCQIPVDIAYRIIYNLDKGVFKPYIKQYLSSVNDIKIKAKKINIQNNPEKRKEAGLYS